MEESKLTDFIEPQASAPLYPNLGNDVEKMKEGEKLFLLKSMISQNRDMSKVILKGLEQPIKSIDIHLSRLNINGYNTIQVYKNFDYNFWIEFHMDFSKESGLKLEIINKYAKGFKDLSFVFDNTFLYISFKTKVDIFENDLKIVIS